MNVQQTCSRLLYPCGHLSMDVTDSGRTWSGRLKTGYDSRQSCWQRIKVVIGTILTRAIAVGDSCSRYSPDTSTCITFWNRSCRLQPRPPHDKVVVVTLVRRPHCVPTPFRADSTTSPIVLNMSKTIGDVYRSVRIIPSPPSSITFPTRPLHDVHVHSKLRQVLVPFWLIFLVVRGSTWQIVTVWESL